MKTKLITASALSGLILAGGIAGAVSAQSAADATTLTEEQVIAIALAEVPGEVTEVELEDRRGSKVYEVEVTDAGGVEMEIKIAADTGDVLKVKEDGKDCDKDDESDGA